MISGGIMVNKLENELERRKQAKRDFYFNSIGVLVKKTRLKRNLTQEDVAKGICSNTYLSKFEHNAVPINEEYLSMIMERIDLGYKNVMFPEEMLKAFNDALDCFIYDDKPGFELLIHTLKPIDFAVLVDIARLGYQIVMNNKTASELIAGELYHYLAAMDSDALGVFMLFNAASKIINNKYDEGLKLLNLFDELDTYSDELLGIIAYLKFVCYGFLGLMHSADVCCEEARLVFSKAKNYRRLAMIDLYSLEFSFYESETVLQFENDSFLTLLNSDEIDRYHFLLAVSGSDVLGNCSKISEDSNYYPESRFVQCLYLLKSGQNESYLESKNELQKLSNGSDGGIDYYKWLKLMDMDAQFDLKDFLIESVLPYAFSIQSIFLMKRATREIVDYLAKNKRYKDALSYVIKLENDIAKLQRKKKPLGMIEPLTAEE